MPCLARLTNWDKTSFRIDSCFTVSHVVLCKNKVSGDSVLCAECLKRPTESKYHTRMIHGLLTDPIPLTSSIYGGPVYWTKMKKFEDAGKVLSSEAKAWIEVASAAQDAAEAIGGCEVQRTGKYAEKMAKAVKARAAAIKSKAAEAKTTLVQKELPKSIFTAVEAKFSESDKAPVKLHTDSMAIKLEVVDGVSVWVAENGMRFEDVKGEIGELIST
jgi:hypothetical protein